MNQGPEKHYAHTMCNCSRCLLRCWCAHSCRYQNCLWIFGKQPATWIDIDAIMLDDTLLLTVCGLMIVIMTSCAHCHTIIHIQSYNHTIIQSYNHTFIQSYNHTIIQSYNHTIIHIQSCNDAAHGYMKHSYEKLYLSLVSAPASVQFSRLIVGSLVPAPATCAVYPGDGWILGLCLCHLQFTKSFVKSFASAPATLQLTRLILKMLVSAPATRGVQGTDCQTPGLCVCHLCSLPDWWLDPWSLCCACHLAVYQVDFQNVGVRACHRWSPVEFSGLIVGSLVCLPPVQFTRVMVGSSCKDPTITLVNCTGDRRRDQEPDNQSASLHRWQAHTTTCLKLTC